MEWYLVDGVPVRLDRMTAIKIAICKIPIIPIDDFINDKRRK